ncbi:hypothetical protein [Streptomyces hygroscopicus]|uniref:hypothetical protein n=1 Tax=Streptomyces hygroscopicus TaxID=1912 RepID=UPI002240E23B|nr:hypothetical protein [Streptomyces hygroscopicus]
MTARQPVPAIDWTDVCGDTQPDPTPEMRSAERRDLWGCGLTADQMHHMTTVTPKPEYL